MFTGGLSCSTTHPPFRQEYAARVHNLRSYDAISRDVLARWAYPFVPDTNLATRGDGPTHYTYTRGRVYM